MSDFNETWKISTDMGKILKYQSQENLFSGSRVVPCGQTDRQTMDIYEEVNGRFLQVSERA